MTVARFDVIRGPVREPIQDYLHRQPLLIRWVVRTDAYDDAVKMIGIPFRRQVDVEIDRVRLE